VERVGNGQRAATVGQNLQVGAPTTCHAVFRDIESVAEGVAQRRSPLRSLQPSEGGLEARRANPGRQLARLLCRLARMKCLPQGFGVTQILSLHDLSFQSVTRPAPVLLWPPSANASPERGRTASSPSTRVQNRVSGATYSTLNSLCSSTTPVAAPMALRVRTGSQARATTPSLVSWMKHRSSITASSLPGTFKSKRLPTSTRSALEGEGISGAPETWRAKRPRVSGLVSRANVLVKVRAGVASSTPSPTLIAPRNNASPNTRRTSSSRCPVRRAWARSAPFNE